MGDDVLQTVDRLLDQLLVEPDSPSFEVTGSPLGLHPLHVHAVVWTADDPLPLL